MALVAVWLLKVPTGLPSPHPLCRLQVTLSFTVTFTDWAGLVTSRTGLVEGETNCNADEIGVLLELEQLIDRQLNSRQKLKLARFFVCRARISLTGVAPRRSPFWLGDFQKPRMHRSCSL